MTAKELVQLVGPTIAWELAKAYGGGVESLPTMKAVSTACKNMAICIASAKGEATGDIARLLDMREESVIRIIKAQSN